MHKILPPSKYNVSLNVYVHMRLCEAKSECLTLYFTPKDVIALLLFCYHAFCEEELVGIIYRIKKGTFPILSYANACKISYNE